MTYMTILVGATTVLGLAMLWCVGSTTHPLGWLRTSILVCTLLFMVVAPTVFYQLLGRPKPVDIAALPKLTTVVSFVLGEKGRVYLTVQSPVWKEPRLIGLEGNKELIQKLMTQQARAKKFGRELGVRVPTTNDSTDVFYMIVPPPLPPKIQ